MELIFLIKALLRRKWIIIASVLLAVIAAFFLTGNIQKKYQSAAQFSTDFTTTEEMKLSDENFNVPQIDQKFNNVIENITSPKVVSFLGYRLLQHDLRGTAPFTVLTAKQKRKDEYTKVNPEQAMKTLQVHLDSLQMLNPAIPGEKDLLDYLDLYGYDVETLQGTLTVTRNAKTDYIDIVCLSPNPDMSAFAANTLFSEFTRFYGVNKQQHSSQSMLMLDSLVTQKKAILDQKVFDKTKFMASQGLVDPTAEGSNAVTQISTYQSQQIEEKANQENLSYRVAQLNDLIKKAREKGATSVDANSVNSGAVNDRSEYTRLRKQYNDLFSDYIQRGRKDSATKVKLDQIERAISKLNLSDDSTTATGDAGVVSLDQLVQKKIDAEAQLRASTEKLGSIQTRLSELNGGLSGMATRAASVEQYDKDIELATTEYKEAKEKLNLSLSLDNTLGGRLKQTLVAQPATQPESSKRMLIVGMAGAIALVLSSLIIVLIEFFDHSIRTPANFTRMTDLPVLGMVNHVKFLDGNILNKIKDESENRRNMFRELLRKLRYELEKSGKKVFLVTSTAPQQGKTSLIQALAYSLSLGKKRVLILDTNFCNNDLTKAVNANPVLEDFSLNGKPFSPSDLKYYVTPTGQPGVDMIGCKGGDYTPTEILPKNHLLKYLGQLQEEYDCIFMEGAPINGFTDAKELLEYCDAMIAIFSAEANLTSTDRESIQFLLENKDKFLGAILNKIPEENLDL